MSESRFVARPFGQEKLYLQGISGHQKVVLAKENDRDRHQKFIMKRDKNAMFLRFDKHPQPYIRATYSGTSDGWCVTMEDWSTDSTSLQTSTAGRCSFSPSVIAKVANGGRRMSIH